MKRLLVLYVVLLALTGCVGAAGLIEALSKDPATACINLTTIYGTLKIARTNATNARVGCNQEGLTVDSGSPAK